MRKLLYILLFLFCSILTAQVNFSTYGAVGDGVTNDRGFLQEALDNEPNLIADPGAVFYISSRLDIDRGFAQTIDWNGATIITNSALSPMVQIDKRATNGGLTTMTDLTIDGNNIAARGLECNSRVNITNVQLNDFWQTTQASPAGLYIHVYNDPDCYGDWIFDNVNVDGVRGDDNGVTTDSWGAANGYLIYWNGVPTTETTLIFNNSEVKNCWGEDSQNVGTFSSGRDISYSLGSMVFNNMHFYDWERRSVKNFTGNATFNNCIFEDPALNNPNLSSKNKSGMVVFGMGSGATGGDNTEFNNCTFIGSGYDGRVIGLQNNDVRFNDCVFTGGARLAFTMWIGDVDICNTTFNSGSSIYGYNISTANYRGRISVGTNTTGPNGYVQVPASKVDYIVCDESTTPYIVLNGSSVENYTVGDDYVEAGAVTYNADGNPAIITGTINMAIAGTYYKYYNVSNNLGIPAAQQTRTIIVEDEPEPEDPPTIVSRTLEFLSATSVEITTIYSKPTTQKIGFGTSSGIYTNYTPEELNHLPMHRQVISNLEMGTTYYAKEIGEGTDEQALVATEFTFTTEAEPGGEEWDWYTGLKSRFLKLLKF